MLELSKVSQLPHYEPAFYFFPCPNHPLSPARSFLPLISAPTGFPAWGLVTRWVQLLITANYFIPRTQNDRSTRRLAVYLLNGVCWLFRMFESHYEDKTGNRWTNRKEFKKMPNKMYPMDLDYGQECEELKKIEVATSK